MRAVFLDRDGVINENRSDYVRSWDEVVFLPGVFESLRKLAGTTYRVIVVSNQSAINRGLVTVETVEDIHRQMRQVVEEQDGRIDAFVYCPHRPDEGCDCRKPKAGMLLEAAQRFSLELPRCYLIGDALSDVRAARAAGCLPILVQTGRGRESMGLARGPEGDALVVVEDLSAAVDWILARGEDSPA